MLKRLAFAVFAIAIALVGSLSATATDSLQACNFESLVSDSFFSWRRFPKFACEEYREMCAQAESTETDDYPKYRYTKDIEEHCENGLESLIASGVPLEKIVNSLSDMGLNCVEATIYGRGIAHNCFFEDVYVMPINMAKRIGYFDGYYSVRYNFAVVLFSENNELTGHVNFTMLMP